MAAKNDQLSDDILDSLAEGVGGKDQYPDDVLDALNPNIAAAKARQADKAALDAAYSSSSDAPYLAGWGTRALAGAMGAIPDIVAGTASIPSMAMSGIGWLEKKVGAEKSAEMYDRMAERLRPDMLLNAPNTTERLYKAMVEAGMPQMQRPESTWDAIVNGTADIPNAVGQTLFNPAAPIRATTQIAKNIAAGEALAKDLPAIKDWSFWGHGLPVDEAKKIVGAGNPGVGDTLKRTAADMFSNPVAAASVVGGTTVPIVNSVMRHEAPDNIPAQVAAGAGTTLLSMLVGGGLSALANAVALRSADPATALAVAAKHGGKYFENNPEARAQANSVLAEAEAALAGDNYVPGARISLAQATGRPSVFNAMQNVWEANDPAAAAVYKDATLKALEDAFGKNPAEKYNAFNITANDLVKSQGDAYRNWLEGYGQKLKEAAEAAERDRLSQIAALRRTTPSTGAISSGVAADLMPLHPRAMQEGSRIYESVGTSPLLAPDVQSLINNLTGLKLAAAADRQGAGVANTLGDIASGLRAGVPATPSMISPSQLPPLAVQTTVTPKDVLDITSNLRTLGKVAPTGESALYGDARDRLIASLKGHSNPELAAIPGIIEDYNNIAGFVSRHPMSVMGKATEGIAENANPYAGSSSQPQDYIRKYVGDAENSRVQHAFDAEAIAGRLGAPTPNVRGALQQYQLSKALENTFGGDLFSEKAQDVIARSRQGAYQAGNPTPIAERGSFTYPQGFDLNANLETAMQNAKKLEGAANSALQNSKQFEANLPAQFKRIADWQKAKSASLTGPEGNNAPFAKLTSAIENGDRQQIRRLAKLADETGDSVTLRESIVNSLKSRVMDAASKGEVPLGPEQFKDLTGKYLAALEQTGAPKEVVDNLRKIANTTTAMGRNHAGSRSPTIDNSTLAGESGILRGLLGGRSGTMVHTILDHLPGADKTAATRVLERALYDPEAARFILNYKGKNPAHFMAVLEKTLALSASTQNKANAIKEERYKNPFNIYDTEY